MRKGTRGSRQSTPHLEADAERKWEGEHDQDVGEHRQNPAAQAQRLGVVVLAHCAHITHHSECILKSEHAHATYSYEYKQQTTCTIHMYEYELLQRYTT